MGKFNHKKTSKKTNLAGGIGYNRDDFKKELASVVLNSLLKGDGYYESEKQMIQKINDYIAKNPKEAEFYAKAMLYARLEGNLRSVSHVMAVSLAENVKGASFVRRAIEKVIKRPDDATEIVALWNSKHDKMSNPIRRAVKDSLEKKWTAYHLKKYFGTKRSVKVSDLIKLSHPVPKDEEQKEIFKMAIEGRLPAIETVQTINAGKTKKARKQAYKKMLDEGTFGYMALLKNLVNILELNPGKKMSKKIAKILTNEELLEKSGVLPLRIAQAYKKAMPYRNQIITEALEKAFSYAGKNIKLTKNGKKIALLLDESASMSFMGSDKSPFELGKVMMASMLSGMKKSRVIGYLWATRARKVEIDSPMKFLVGTFAHGGGTDIASPIEAMIRNKEKVDTIVIFTDMQHNSLRQLPAVMRTYKEELNPDVKLIFWNLMPYSGSTPMKLSDNVLEVNGYSDKMLKLIPKLLEDPDALVKEIENVKL